MITFYEAIQAIALAAILVIGWFVYIDIAVPLLEKRENKKLEKFKRDILK